MFLFLLIFLFLPQIFCFNALFLSFHDSGSHQGSMSKLFYKLAKSGHNITVFDTTSKKEKLSNPKNLLNLNFVDGRTFIDYTSKLNLSKRWWETYPSSTDCQYIYLMGDNFFGDLILMKSNITTKILNQNFDVIIVDDLFSVHGFYFAEFFYEFKNVPIIQYGTTIQLGTLQSARAHHHHFLNEPSNAGPMAKSIKGIFNPRKFVSRFVNFYTKTLELFAMPFFAEIRMTNLQRELENKFSFQDHFAKSSLLLTECFSGVGLPLSLGNDVHYVGHHCPKIGKLEPEFEEFLNDKNSKGTIILAFGSHVKWDAAPKYIIDAYFGAFENLTDYKIVFSYNGPPKNVSKHIKLSPWLPQKELLNHPTTKVFIGHSGLKSTNEAICASVPLIFMPSSADQKYNTELWAYLGHAEYLNKYSLTKKKILKSINKVLNNYSEKKSKMLNLRKIYLDKIIEPMNLAEFWVTKTVERNKKNSNVVFPRKGIKMSWLEYCNFDLFTIFCFFIWFVSK